MLRALDDDQRCNFGSRRASKEVSPSSDTPKFFNVFFDSSIEYAGKNVIDSSHAENIPKLTNRPKSFTGGIGVIASEANPAVVVRDVNNIGAKSSSIVC